jgi:fatty acid desaturase
MRAPVTTETTPRKDAIDALINDPRDRPFVILMTIIGVMVPPFGIAFFVPGVFRWWLAFVYLNMVAFVFLDRFILMMHNTSHRPLFRRRWMNNIIPWFLGPFFGQTPESYFAHHIGMHHPENNLDADLSSTMPYQRDSAPQFLLYYFRFLIRGLPDLARYLTEHDRKKLRTRMLLGEISWIVATVALMFYNWQATIVVLVFPLFAVRFLMMAGNWGQHAFVDEKTPEVAYRNSIVVLDDRYNRRAFNDGYHIGHHIKATRHWTEMPADFEQNRETYAREGAIVFKDISYFVVWWFLMLHQYKKLAHYYYPLGDTRPSDEEIIALLRERARAIRPLQEVGSPALG